MITIEYNYGVHVQDYTHMESDPRSSITTFSSASAVEDRSIVYSVQTLREFNTMNKPQSNHHLHTLNLLNNVGGDAVAARSGLRNPVPVIAKT